MTPLDGTPKQGLVGATLGFFVGFAAIGARIQIQREGNFQVALPESAEFLKSDLTRDLSSDLDRAEKPH